MARGELRVYLGAAPGVGKTFSMLDEGWRRHQRGTDVVVGVVETHGRAHTAAQLRDLEVMPRRTIRYRDAELPEMDVDAILARRPDVALVDELAHTNVPGSRHEKRWQDIKELLDAGITVISTINIQHLESLNDVVEKITGVVQRETVPDVVVRQADQIELVDMSPEALRRRMAHGNVYPPERVDAALSNYFRLGNLGALRELALLWVADRVEQSLDDYRARHGIVEPWETRERVVVAITGAPGGDALIRRASRIAGRNRGELVGVHVTSADGLRNPKSPGELERYRDLLTELDGTYHELTGDDVSKTLTSFARTQGATQLVVGASRRSRLQEIFTGSIVSKTVRGASGIDVHVIATEPQPSALLARPRRPMANLPRSRVIAGWITVLVGLPVLTVLLAASRDSLTLATGMLLYLGVVVAAGALGGVLPGFVGAVAGSLLANYYLVPPIHTFTVSEPQNLFTLAVFVAIAAVVSGYVNLAARRAHDATRARAEAEALARTTATLVGSPDPLPQLVDQLRSGFALDGVGVLRRTGGVWTDVASSGLAPHDPSEGRTMPLEADGGTVLVLVGGRLTGDDERVLRSHADQLSVALSSRDLQLEAARVATLVQIDGLRTAILQAVSHDLRTPLASIKTAVTSLLSTDVSWEPATVLEFLTTINDESDRLTRLVSNLLDMSRLQADSLTLHPGAVGVEDVVSNAISSLSVAPAKLELDIAADIPPVSADADLLERAIANVLSNAVAFSPPSQPITVQASRDGTRMHLRIVDRGPGIPPGERGNVVRPFQRLGDQHTANGVGLGLAVASGFVAAMGGELALDDTPGGGLTVDITLRSAAEIESAAQ